VVERDEADLCRQVAWIRRELLMRVYERLVEDLAERVRDLRACAVDVGGDDLRLGDYLVAKARVELNVTRLVDLLR
jgi:hypothetical protein